MRDVTSKKASLLQCHNGITLSVRASFNARWWERGKAGFMFGNSKLEKYRKELTVLASVSSEALRAIGHQRPRQIPRVG